MAARKSRRISLTTSEEECRPIRHTTTKEPLANGGYRVVVDEVEERVTRKRTVTERLLDATDTTPLSTDGASATAESLAAPDASKSIEVGDCVLAYFLSSHRYSPAIVHEINEAKQLYSVTFFDGFRRKLQRKHIHSPTDPEFGSCAVDDIDVDALAEPYKQLMEAHRLAAQ